MKICAAVITLVLSCSVALGNAARLSDLSVPAETLGVGWVGPTGLVIDDIDDPPTTTDELKNVIEGLRKQMRPLGVKGTADFTYRNTADPLGQVTLRVFRFETEEQCRKWMTTKYQFPGWETKYKKLEVDGDLAFDSLEVKKRIICVGRLWITAGSMGNDDTHLKALEVLLKKAKKQKP